MVSGSEMKALKTVEKENGETTTRLVSRQLRIDTPYARELCMNLTRSNYLNQETHGRFKITLKGKKALGWGLEDVPARSDAGLASKNVQREEFQWRSFSATGRGRQAIENPFLKPGQEDVGWKAIPYGDSANRFGRGNGTGQASLINEKTHSCGFCGGTGKKEKAAKCPVCLRQLPRYRLPPGYSMRLLQGEGHGTAHGAALHGMPRQRHCFGSPSHCLVRGLSWIRRRAGNGYDLPQMQRQGCCSCNGNAPNRKRWPKWGGKLNHGHGTYEG